MNYVHTGLEILGAISGVATALGNLLSIFGATKNFGSKVLTFGIDLKALVS